MFKKIVITLMAVALLVFFGGALYYWNQISLPVSSDETEVLLTIKQGEGVKEIAANLISDNLIRSQFWFETYVYFDRSETKFVAGNYILRPDMNIRDIVNTIKSGKAADEEKITLLEGWDISEIGDYLESENIVSKSDFIKATQTTDTHLIIPDKDYDFLSDKPKDQGLEGYLFPDTYRIYSDANSVDIIEKTLDNFNLKFTDQMKADAVAGQMSTYEIITLASIIEKEVRTDEDRRIAAGIFYDRLNLGVALQSDATVNYVTGKQELQPSADDLQVENLYNTYKYKGLPPGPICNPSLSSMMAAIYPEKSEYFYFLTKPDGTTVFSKTYEEHLENKRRYLQ